ncbi:matrix-remodeling-associated protein 7 [Rhynchocyon petersi]
MEAPAELLAALPVLATALALLLAWLLVRRGAATATPEPPEPPEPQEPPAKASEVPAPSPLGAPEPVAAPREEPGESAPAEAEEAPETAQEEELDPDSETGLAQEEPKEEGGGETFSFKYSPGKLRGNQYKQMLSKEELEEERRVQKEQLEAIFKLMKDNKETFGEMSDGDVQEQLRLYDM